jgi:hypothetical protein
VKIGSFLRVMPWTETAALAARSSPGMATHYPLPLLRACPEIRLSLRVLPPQSPTPT